VIDAYGEETADAIVLAAARRIEACMRSGDVVGRVGFDRFTVIVNQYAPEELTAVAGRFLSTIRETPMSTPAVPMTITGSIGISVFPDDGPTAREIVAYQPIVSTAAGDVFFYEGLVRMLDESGKPIAASGFVPVVEQMGLMRLIDRRVLGLGLDTLELNPEMQLSINVSGLTAVDPI